MAKPKRSDQMQSLLRSLAADRQGRFRKFPDQTAHSLKDDRVVAAIEGRFADRAGIRDVRQLDYDFHTGLHHLVFEFTPGPSGADALLVILDGDCKVIGLMDPFDPVQPNKFVPPLPKDNEQPFVLERPSASQSVAFSDQALYPLQVRNRAFFERLRVGGSFPGPVIDINSWTWCSFETWTPYGTVIDTIIDDCGTEPWLA